MATVRDAGGFSAVGAGSGVGVVMTVALAVAGCGDLKGLGGSQPPLMTFNAMTSGVAPAAPRSLQVALVWGAQWLTEPFCVLPAESDAAAAIIAAGCRDPFGFVPLRVAMSVPITADAPASLSLFDLPSADVMVGDVTARVAYGSLVVYDDRDGSGTLELATPHRTPSGGRRGDFGDVADSADVIYGASFVTMTAPDQRVSYREGAFNETSAFYPRSGCDDPPRGFAVIGAGGFTREAGLASAAAGQLPAEDRSACTQAAPGDTVVNVALQAPSAALREVGCVERADDSSTRYREPPADEPDFSGRMTACAHLPTFDAGGQSSLIQLVVSGRDGDRCMGLTHYTLRGCRENVSCPVPDWDFTANPPAWWKCPH
ncbi:MAG TPA: hypothetical protein VNO55_11705 [Polyangia bacterium]|nr:hypothetical protein [Polyangia bacterium]